LFSVMELVDQYRLGPYYKFRDKYIVSNETGKVLGYRNLNEIGKTLSHVLIRRRKKDVALQLPERMDKNLFIPVTREQMEMHEELSASVSRIIQKWNNLHFISETERRRLLLCLSQMRMLCDSTYILDQKTRFDTKVDEVMNILESVFESGEEKVVIFSQWERMTRLVARELDKKGVSYDKLDGTMSASSRRDSVNDFTENSETRVFLSTDAGCTGLNLQVASLIINLDLPWNPAVLEQRIARIYRIGQKRNIQVLNLVAPHTIEERMLGKLRFKTSMFEGVLDNGDDSVFIDDDKFSKLMDTIGDMMSGDDEETNAGQQVVDTTDMEMSSENKQEASSGVSESDVTQDSNFDEVSISPEIPSDNESEVSTATKEKEQVAEVRRGGTTQQQLVADGISFFTRLSETLKSPEETEKLVSNLIVEDKETGETSLRIPVPNKQVVKQLLDVVGKLFGK
jgi:superfamily II DNA/RNA helicase